MLPRLCQVVETHCFRLVGTKRSLSASSACLSKAKKDLHEPQKKINDCYIPICDAKTWEPPRDTQELCRAGRFIVENLYPYEPILLANGIKPTSTLTTYYMEIAKEGKLVYGIVEEEEGYEKLGIALGHPIPLRNAFEELDELARRIKHEGTRHYMQLLAEIEKKKNIALLYNTKKNLSLDVLVVHSTLRRRQVSKMLLKSFIESAVEDEYEIIRFATSNEFAFKAASELGFKPIYAVEPDTLRDLKGEKLVPHPLCLPHRELKIMVKDIRNEKKKPKPTKCGEAKPGERNKGRK